MITNISQKVDKQKYDKNFDRIFKKKKKKTKIKEDIALISNENWDDKFYVDYKKFIAYRFDLGRDEDRTVKVHVTEPRKEYWR